MRPNASRLVYRVKTAIKGESNGLETAKLAWLYAQEIERYQARLEKCLETENDLDAYLLAYSKPGVLDALDTLAFPDAPLWNEQCQRFRWRMAPEIKTERISALQDRFTRIGDVKSWLEGEFRSRARAKELFEAFRVVNVLNDRFGEHDPSLSGEYDRLKAQALKLAEKELQNASGELMPEETPRSIASRYQRYGLELPTDAEPFASVIGDIEKARIQESTRSVESIIERAKAADSDESRMELEKAYFECDYLLLTSDTRSKIEPMLRGSYSSVETEISHHRANFESNILIQKSIDDLRKVLQGVSIRFGRKKATVHDAVDRLKSIQGQAKKMGRPISSELQTEIKRALAEAKRKRAPKYAIIGAGGIAALLAIAWLVDNQVETNRHAEVLQTATAAINQAAARQNIGQAERTLRQWGATIAEAPDGHALKLAASQLESWIDVQQTLQASYSEIADRLDDVRGAENADPASPSVDELLEQAERIGSELDVSPLHSADERIAEFIDWRETRASRLEADRRKTLLAYVSAAQDNLEQAGGASDSPGFEASSKRVVEAIASARMLVTRHPELDSNELQRRSLKRIEDALASLQDKRDNMAAAQSSVKGASDLASYLQSLEAIYNFDTLPPEGKRNIGRILRLENEYQSLLQALILPDDDAGYRILSGETDYVSEKISLEEDEEAFLQRLIDDTLFPAIYESKVKYFEGSPVAKSEYSEFLKEPVQKGDTAGLKTGINFSFKVWGFNENGEADEAPQEMNFLSHPDGTFWGFFYEPSELSNESIYFQESLRLSLMRILAGGERFAPLKLIDDLTRTRTLSPAYRVYWQQQLTAFMDLNPWKWGLPLSPTLAQQINSLEEFAPAGVGMRQWLSSVEQFSPSIQLTEHLRLASQTKLVEEARAFASLYQFAARGEMSLIGQADESGKIEYNGEQKYENDTLWIVNRLTGRIEILENGKSIAPYSPVLAYRFEDQSAERLLQKTRAQTGWDLSLEQYAASLPPLLK